MPKAGWIEIPYDECPMCGKRLPEPDEHNLLFVYDPDYNKFTGAIATPVCCKVYLTWRSSDELWHYEIPDHIRWKHTGGADHELNKKYHRGYVLPGRRVGSDMPETDRRDLQRLADEQDRKLQKTGRMPIKYDFI